MRQNTCTRCGGTFPINDTYQVFGRLLCEPCGNRFLADRPGGVPPEAVVPQLDPTVCRKCQADGGDRELPRVAGVPMCPECAYGLRHRPFPGWVKISFLVLLALAITSFVHNLRFFLGYVEMRLAPRAMARGDAAKGAALMSSAAEHLPEIKNLKTVAAYYQGIDLTTQDRWTEAVPLFQQCLAELPPQAPRRAVVEEYLLTAEAGVAFDAKDYDTFLTKETALLKREPNEPMALAAVASAHACKYAVTGQEAHRQEAMKYLDEAAKHTGAAEIAEYRQRILYRLHTREIIDKKEYDRRFPQGWKAEKTS